LTTLAADSYPILPAVPHHKQSGVTDAGDSEARVDAVVTDRGLQQEVPAHRALVICRTDRERARRRRGAIAGFRNQDLRR